MAQLPSLPHTLNELQRGILRPPPVLMRTVPPIKIEATLFGLVDLPLLPRTLIELQREIFRPPRPLPSGIAEPPCPPGQPFRALPKPGSIIPVISPSVTPPYQQPLFEQQRASERAKERIRHLNITFSDLTLKPFNSYLDIGAGNAQITYEIGKTYNIRDVYAVDVYPERDFRQPSEISRIIYKQIRDSRIDLPNESVDLVTAFVLIHHVRDVDTLLREINRVLKPGGWFFIREHDVISPDKIQYLNEVHRKFSHGQIEDFTKYWSRKDLDKFITDHGFDHISDSDYTEKNPQALYHTLYLRV